MSNPKVWENPENVWENPSTTKKKKKGIGSLIEKIKDAGHKKEKKKEEKGEESQVAVEESQEVDHDIAASWGAELLIPVQQALAQKRLKATLPQAATMAQHLSTETEHLKAEDDPSLKGKNFDLDKPQSVSNQNLSGPIEKARAKEADLSQLEKEKEKGPIPLNMTDVLQGTLPEARKLGERMGTTSPKSEQKKKEETKKKEAPKSQQKKKEESKPAKKGKSKTPPGRTSKEEIGTKEVQSSKEEPTKSKSGKKGLQSKDKGGKSTKEETQPVQTGPQIEGKVAADFLKANLNEARKLGEKMGTTSPKGRTLGKQSTGSAAIQGKTAAEFLKDNVNEARKLGEKMGTTSPKEKSSTTPSGLGESTAQVRGSVAAEFLRSNVNEARKLGEKKGTTSPKTVVSKPPTSMEDFTSGFKETTTHEPKTGLDILRETVSKARELGEKFGTTSPKPTSESIRSYKEESKLSQRE